MRSSSAAVTDPAPDAPTGRVPAGTWVRLGLAALLVAAALLVPALVRHTTAQFTDRELVDIRISTAPDFSAD